MKDFCFRFLVADEGIKVDFVQASPTEVIFKVYRTDATVSPESNISEATVETPKENNAVIEEAVPASEDNIVGSTKYRLPDEEAVSAEEPKSAEKPHIDKTLLTKLWNDGIHAKEIAVQLGTTEGTVYAYAAKIDECLCRKKKSAIDAELFRKMWNDDIHVKVIAEKVGLSVNSVYTYARRIPGCKSRKNSRPTSIETSVEQTTNVPQSIQYEPVDNAEVVTNDDYPKTGEHLRPNEVDALCKMWRNGQQNVAYLAKYFGVSKSCIYYQLRVNGCRR